MSLKVETGLGEIDSETLVSEEDFVELCSKRGITINVEQASKHLVLAMDFLNTFEGDFGGVRSNVDQALPFPRRGLKILKRLVGDDTVPQEARYVQVFAAIASFNGIDLMPVKEPGKQLLRKKTGPLEKEWARTGQTQSLVPVVPQAVSYLALLSGDTAYQLNQRV